MKSRYRQEKFQGIEGQFQERYLAARRVLDEKLTPDKVNVYSPLSIYPKNIKGGIVRVYVETCSQEVLFEIDMYRGSVDNFMGKIEQYVKCRGFRYERGKKRNS
jgi:hypothetical protein